MKSFEKKSWDDLNKAGMLPIMNSILKLFGWSVLIEWVGSDIIIVYPIKFVRRKKRHGRKKNI